MQICDPHRRVSGPVSNGDWRGRVIKFLWWCDCQSLNEELCVKGRKREAVWSVECIVWSSDIDVKRLSSITGRSMHRNPNDDQVGMKGQVQ